ncbi:hypothetical protein H8E77_09925 [bacterium]|nr:hypothetical protein [bacterium]
MQKRQYRKRHFFNKHPWVRITLLFTGINILILAAGLTFGSLLYMGR